MNRSSKIKFKVELELVDGRQKKEVPRERRRLEVGRSGRWRREERKQEEGNNGAIYTLAGERRGWPDHT